MWRGLKLLTAVLIAAASLSVAATRLQAPRIDALPAALTGSGHPASCKALPPLAVEAVAVPGSTNRWHLQLRTLDEDRDVRVWMHTTPDDRRLVWQGRLQFGDDYLVEATYAPPAGAERVYVALEPADMGTSIVRALGVATLGHARLAAISEGVVLEDPATGVKVRQFTGAQEGPR